MFINSSFVSLSSKAAVSVNELTSAYIHETDGGLDSDTKFWVQISSVGHQGLKQPQCGGTG